MNLCMTGSLLLLLLIVRASSTVNPTVRLLRAGAWVCSMRTNPWMNRWRAGRTTLTTSRHDVHAELASPCVFSHCGMRGVLGGFPRLVCLMIVRVWGKTGWSKV